MIFPGDGKCEKRNISVWRNSDASESEKTLSAVGSIGEMASPFECPTELSTFKPISGKILVRHCDSQSTSGYSSPTHKNSITPVWSTNSSIDGSNNDIGKTISYVIHNTNSSAVISLFSQPSQDPQKSVSLITISGSNIDEPRSFLHSTAIEESEYEDAVEPAAPVVEEVPPTNLDVDSLKLRKEPVAPPSVWNVKSLLKKKKNSPPRLCAELEGAIVKSESLAYLSELELLARHQRNKDIQRVRSSGDGAIG